MWALFLLGLVGQISFLDHALVGFAGSTAFLYAVVAGAFLRVAILNQRARKFCLFWMASNAGASSLFLLLALFPGSVAHFERGVLWCNVVWEAVSVWIFFFVSEAFSGWDLPVDIHYMIKRYEGFHMMTMVCTFLFPIALQGGAFEASWEAAAKSVRSDNARGLLLHVYGACRDAPARERWWWGETTRD